MIYSPVITKTNMIALVLVLSSLVAMITSEPVVETWDFKKLSALQLFSDKKDQPELMPYYIEALNIVMLALFTGKDSDKVQVEVQSPSGHQNWTYLELQEAHTNNKTNPIYKQGIDHSFSYFRQNNNKEELDSLPVYFIGMDISTWTESDVDEYLANGNTKPALIPYLQKMKKEFDIASATGVKKEKLTIVTPMNLVRPIPPLYLSEEEIVTEKSVSTTTEGDEKNSI